MITIYLYENTIQYKENEEIKENVFPKEAMAYGKIKDINLFEQTLYKFINKEKRITFLKKKKIHLIIPGNYENVDKEILLTVLNNLGLTHITCHDEKTLYTINKNQIYLNIHSSYLFLTKKTSKNLKTISYPYYIFNGFENTINYIIQNYKNTHFYLLGSNEQIPKYVIKMQNKKVYYYQNYKNYIISKIP